MLLKRKRSEDELSSFSSSRPMGCSSPIRSDHGDIAMMDADSPISPHTSAFSPLMQSRSRSCTPSHLPSRTFKRLRNGRPSEQEVHHNTLKMLYTAQQQNPEPHHVFSPPVTSTTMPSMPPPQAPPAQNQASLHSFWKLPTPPQSSQSLESSSNLMTEAASLSTACEDCGVGLSEDDAMMDDGYGFETYINACSACARAVCFSCSVGNLAEQRRCLRCAGREKLDTEKARKWVGHLSWTREGLTVC